MMSHDLFVQFNECRKIERAIQNKGVVWNSLGFVAYTETSKYVYKRYVLSLNVYFSMKVYFLLSMCARNLQFQLTFRKLHLERCRGTDPNFVETSLRMEDWLQDPKFSQANQVFRKLPNSTETKLRGFTN